jgi:hypothetical protein
MDYDITESELNSDSFDEKFDIWCHKNNIDVDCMSELQRWEAVLEFQNTLKMPNEMYDLMLSNRDFY